MRRGFTLIELLVVIAIIALLIGIILPALSNARASSRAVKSLANLRSHAQGLVLYTNDHGVLIPFKMVGTHSSGRVNARYQFVLGDYLGTPFLPRNEIERDRFENTNDFDRLDNAVFLDPVHSYEDMRSQQSGEIQVLRCGSYGYNFRYLGNTRTGLDGRMANFPVPLSRIQMPSKTIAFGTSGGAVALRAEGFREHAYTLDAPRLASRETNTDRWAHSSGPSPLEARHQGKAQAAWLDGHVSATDLEDYGYEIFIDPYSPIGVDRGSNALFNGRGYDNEALLGRR